MVTTERQGSDSSQEAGAWQGCVQGCCAGKLKTKFENELQDEDTRPNDTYQSLRGLPHVAWQAPHPSPWHNRSQWWKPHASSFPHVVPHDTFSCACEHLTLSTIFFPHAHCFVVRCTHGGHGVGSSWHRCDIFGCPQGGGGRGQGYTHAIRVPQGVGGSRTVRPQ